ncbi:MAG: SIS domain-containing protein, partial [Elusimicrobia bacterium]|nr:SIS domain-containing protein [Elusimicrobiota bacterium]
MNKWIDEYIEQHKKIISGLNKDIIIKLIEAIKKTRDEGRQIFIIGNGGDAAIASHLGVDLGKGGSLGKKKRFRVFVPSDNVPWLTAIANDLSYEDVFVEQIENFARPDDFLLALSVSGSSPNIVKAIKRAKEIGMGTAAIVGDRQGKVIDMVDMAVV